MSSADQPATLSRGAGFLFAIAAAILWSAAGIGIKLLPLPGPAIAGYRALFSLPVFVAALLLRGPRLRQASFYARALRHPLIAGTGLAYAACVTLFVLANKQTSAANAILFQYSAPIYVALLSGPLLGERVDEVIPVPLPHWTGPADCLHLLSFISPVDVRKAVVYSRLMPVPFRQLLLERGWQLIEVPDAEYDTMACNVLAVAPGQCVMLAGNPVTQARLEVAGVRVAAFEGDDLCLKGGGGPTCLTRPLYRG